jgi:hypothetical protein
MSTYRTLVIYYENILRDERLNVGLLMVAPEHNFVKVKFVDSKVAAKLYKVLMKVGDEKDYSNHMTPNRINTFHKDWSEIQLDQFKNANIKDRDIFKNLLGEPHYMFYFKWRSASVGILNSRTPEETFDECFKMLVAREEK